jgi:hypothetical protein
MKRLGVEGAGGRRKKRKATQDGGVNKESSDEREREKKKEEKYNLKDALVGRRRSREEAIRRVNKKAAAGERVAMKLLRVMLLRQRGPITGRE